MHSTFKNYNATVFAALALAFVYHGALLLSGTFKGTYDAFVHIFFADHYARAWFDHWEPRWYTGFPMTSYPPGSQQTVALLSFGVGLETAFVIVATFAIMNCTLGIYRFSRIWVSDEASGYAALLFVFASSIAETVHVFGQLPTIFSLGFLLNALPFVHRWIMEGRVRWLVTAWLLNAATTAGHHVTTLFGAIFFVAPVIVFGLVTQLRTPLPDEPPQRPASVTRANLRPLLVRRIRRVLPGLLRAAVYGPGLIAVLILVVLPYWLWSKSDPITQVSIPHASRDSFIKNTSAGLVFWVIPYGLTILTLPYVFYKGLSTRAWPMTLSLAMLVFLGTGGTTPFPRMLLRGAFDILTLDRFTFWATITQLPLLGEFVVSLRAGKLARYTREQFGNLTFRLVQVSLIVSYIGIAAFIANFTKFRKFQPDPIDVHPIITFLDKDQHSRWRYLTLGFGDQMAWLSAQTTASTVDGNYHSARRLPELTTTPVERLEGSKYSGIPGIGSLQQFVAIPDKYNLKFVFSNDQFYDPLLFFSGWHRLQRLENGIMVWEREDIPPMPEVLPRKEIPYVQRVMWGVVPMLALVSAALAFLSPLWQPSAAWLFNLQDDRFTGLYIRRRFWTGLSAPIRWIWPEAPELLGKARPWSRAANLWRAIDRRLLERSALPTNDDTRSIRWQVWLTWVGRLPRPRPVGPNAHYVRLALAVTLLVGTVGIAAWHFFAAALQPKAIIEGYYDDLDFRRFALAYARLDPRVRSSYDHYLLDLSVAGGMVASYGKLDSVRVTELSRGSDDVTLDAQTDWITSVAKYHTTQRLALRLWHKAWVIEPDIVDIRVPPEQFFRRGEVGWVSAGRRRATTETTSFADILDRPELQIFSARLVKHAARYSVVGELINIDADPADLTVTGILSDLSGKEMVRYNAQQAIIHKIFPKEVTPFRVDFEGVAGAALETKFDAKKFHPDAFTPPLIDRPIGHFDVYAKAVVTQKDLYRDLTSQNIHVQVKNDGSVRLTAELLNVGTREATIPHVLVTYYDEANRVAWVDDAYIRDAVRPFRTQPIDLLLTKRDEVQTVLDKGDLFANNLQNELPNDNAWRERIVLPVEVGFASLRISVHYFVGTTD